MTAEAVILNKHAVAMAADSAVTVGGAKVFNTANKIFALSAHHPVGLMVYGNAEFMGIPWETLIKLFRREVGSKRKPALEDYAHRFIGFLRAQADLLPAAEQQRFVEGYVGSYFAQLVALVRKAVQFRLDEVIAHGGSVNSDAIGEAYVAEAAAIVDRAHEMLTTPYMEPTPTDEDVNLLRERYSEPLKRVRDHFFGELALSDATLTQLSDIAIQLLRRGAPGTASGVVIAGYGEEEIFPHLRAFSIWGMAGGRLLYSADRQMAVDISYGNAASIVPFAQQEMVHTFMEGVDPEYQVTIEQELTQILNAFVDASVAADDRRTEEERAQLTKALHEITSDLVNQCREHLKGYRDEHQVQPVLDVVAALPKDELAEMAEALVNLTSFKRKVSREQETVGGPIDVAVISKGDGLVWIKRKHYFQAELNPHFAVRYQGGCADGH